MENISKHISYKEGIFSHTAKRNRINNEPNKEQLEAMKLVAEKVFEPLRAHFNVPIKINSFFRSAYLNSMIGGAFNSQHVKGEAIDLDDTLGGLTNKQIFEFIRDNLTFDQIIWEHGDKNNPDWVHVSYSKDRNRNQVLKASKVKGKTVYTILK